MLQTSQETAICVTGLFRWVGSNVPILIVFSFFMATVFLCQLSFFGFVSQFIYRFRRLFGLMGEWTKWSYRNQPSQVNPHIVIHRKEHTFLNFLVTLSRQRSILGCLRWSESFLLCTQSYSALEYFPQKEFLVKWHFKMKQLSRFWIWIWIWPIYNAFQLVIRFLFSIKCFWMFTGTHFFFCFFFELSIIN